MLTKSQFYSKPSIASLPAAEKARRYAQHRASAGGGGRHARRQSAPSRASGSSSKAHVPECLLNYTKALLNPFETPAACLPARLSQPSQKTRVFARGVMEVGTFGIGWLTARATPVNDGAALCHTVAAYGGSATTEIDTAAFGTQIVNHNAPYALARMTDRTLQARIVACGVRIRYIGKELDRGGTITAFQDPAHETLNQNGHSYNQIRGYDRAITVPNKRQWVSAVYIPIDYHTGERWHDSSVDGAVANFCLALMIADTPGTQYEYEYYAHFEYIGHNVRSKTTNQSDERWTNVAGKLGQLGTVFFDKAAAAVGPSLDAMARNVITSALSSAPVRMALTL